MISGVPLRLGFGKRTRGHSVDVVLQFRHLLLASYMGALLPVKNPMQDERFLNQVPTAAFFGALGLIRLVSREMDTNTYRDI